MKQKISSRFLSASSGLTAAILLIFTALIFAGGITPSFSADDYPHLLKNIDRSGIQEIMEVFTRLDGREYRPLVRWSLWLNSRMGSDALPYHLTNLVLHLFSTLSLTFLLALFTPSRIAVFFGTMLFALHPIHITNIHFVMGRTDLLCAAFYFPSAFFFARSIPHEKDGPGIAAALLLFCLALLSKEMAVTLPAVLLMAGLAVGQGDPEHRLRVFLRILPFACIAALYLFLRISFWLQAPQNVSVYTDFTPRHIASNLLQWFVGLLFPFELYRLRDVSIAHPAGLILPAAAMLLLLAVPAAFAIARHRDQARRLLAFAFPLAWFLITLLPISGGNAHRWYLYIPSAGLAIAAVRLLSIFQDKKRKTACMLLLTLLSGAYAMESAVQTKIWSGQSRISQAFLQQVEDLGLDRLDALYFANVPFGYKSAFLFTFNSLQDAIDFHYGRRPTIHILSYLNLNDDLALKTRSTPDRLIFELEPDHYGFLIVPPLTRNFARAHETLSLASFQVRIDALSPARKATRFEIVPTAQPVFPVFYYDGRRIGKAF